MSKCPKCKSDTRVTKVNIFRPFCSKKCQETDLGAWANEQYTIPDHDLSLSITMKNDYNDDLDEKQNEEENMYLHTFGSASVVWAIRLIR